MANDKRPVNLDLASIRFPVMAITSILHRISGVGLFILMPYMLYLLGNSLKNAGTYQDVLQHMQTPFARVALLLFALGMVYHLVAGIRHMIMDLGFGESLEAGQRSAYLLLAVSAVIALLVGYWIC